MIKTFRRKQTSVNIYEIRSLLEGHIYAYGRIGCLDEDTEIYCFVNDKIEKIKIKDLPDNFNVVSYNFKRKKKEKKEAIKIDVGIKKCYEIEFEDGEKVIATKEHRFFNEDNKEVRVDNLKVGDKLLFAEKIRQDLYGKNNPSKRLEVRKKLSENFLGDKNPSKRLEVRKKISIANKGKLLGEKNPMKKEENKLKHKIAMRKLGDIFIKNKTFYGKNNPAYIHGNHIGKKNNSRIYINLAKNNFEWVCKMCNKQRNEQKNNLCVHHIDGNNKNNNINNLMVLCNECHMKMHRPLMNQMRWNIKK